MTTSPKLDPQSAPAGQDELDPLFDCTVQQVIDACSQATSVDALVQSLIKTVKSKQGSPDATFKNHLQWVCDKLVNKGVLKKNSDGTFWKQQLPPLRETLIRLRRLRTFASLRSLRKLGKTASSPSKDYSSYSVLLSGRNAQLTTFRHVLLIVALADELKTLRSVATDFGGVTLPKETATTTYANHSKVYPLSHVSGFRVDVLPASMGPFGPRSIGATLTDYLTKNGAVELVVLVGTAFGISEQEQKLGDVLIGTSIFLYDRRTVISNNVGFEYSYITAQSPIVSGRSEDWIPAFEKWGNEHSVQTGCILTGGAIVQSQTFRDSLRKKADTFLDDARAATKIIGGEMEAAGLAVITGTAARSVPWVVVKAIMDFGTPATRNDLKNARKSAAKNAADAVFRVLRYAHKDSDYTMVAL